jgi:hypothetical protein
MYKQRQLTFRLCYRNNGNKQIFGEITNKNHCFYALIFVVVKALRQWRQIREVMNREDVNYSKIFKQSSDEAFNTGKKIEAMKHLMLHRIASSLLLPSIAPT